MQAGLCQAWSETRRQIFSRRGPWPCLFIEPIQSDIEIRDSHEVGCEAQNMSMGDNPPGFESMGDEIDGALPLVEAEPVQPMESADTVSYVIFEEIGGE